MLLQCIFTSRYLNLLTGRKSAFSPRRDDSLHQFMWNLAQPMGTWVRFAVQNFTPVGARGWERNPQNRKNFHFLVKSHPTGANPLTDFYNCYGLLYTQLSCISLSHLTQFTSQVTELLLRNHAFRCEPFSPKFSVHRVGKTVCILDQHLYNVLDVLYHHEKFGGDRTMHAGWRCENMVFVCFLCVCHAPVRRRARSMGA